MNQQAAWVLIGPAWLIGWLFTIGYAKLLWRQVTGHNLPLQLPPGHAVYKILV
jgi:hypothetical protein